ncbi:MAG: hypothetical protein ACYCO3_11670, partial [Mycobacteriales bacterium]
QARLDLVRSVANHALRLARSVAETERAIIATWHASAEDLTDRLRLFQQTLDEVSAARSESLAIGEADFARLRRETDEQAAALLVATAPGLIADVLRHLEHSVGAAGTVESEALGYAAARIREVVQGWQEARTQEINLELAGLETRLMRRLTEQIRTVRVAASTLLPLELPEWPVTSALLGEASVPHRFAPDPGQVEALATAVRRRLPGQIGRRRVARYVAEESRSQLDRHVGLVRSAFQSLLETAKREMGAELNRRFDEGAGRIAQAINAAATRRDQDKSAQEEQRAEVESRLRRAEELVERLLGMVDVTKETDRGAAFA